MKGSVKLSALIVFSLAIFMTACTKNEVTNISLDKSSISLIIGQVDSVVATIDATGDVNKLPQTWTSSVPTVASVIDGVITAKSSGTTVITVKAGEKTATCEVTVNEVPNISLDKSSISLIVGQIDSVEVTIDVSKLSQIWTSSVPAVATVKAGVITAKSSGTTIITVKAGEKTATCEVTVDDKIFPALSQGQLWYWGDVYKTATDTIAASSSNNFTIYLGSAGINLDNLTGNGEIMTIELNTPLTVKDSIPVGIYEMMSKLDQSQLIQYKLVPAFLQDGYQYGCWYYGKTINPVILGTVLVTRSANVYKLVYELFDDYGVKISGTYLGELTYMDGSQPSTVRSNVKVNHQTSFKSTSSLIRR